LPDHTLLITPADPSLLPTDLTALISELGRQGLIGATLDPQRFPNSYAIGDAYPRLLSFMGCSPHFKTEPEHADDNNFCRLQILGPWTDPRLLGRVADASPRCPSCRKIDRQWREQSAEPATDDQWRCPHCGTSANWGSLDWRRRAGFARLALVMHHVFEGEVVPSPELLATLSAHSGGPWTWFYA